MRAAPRHEHDLLRALSTFTESSFKILGLRAEPWSLASPAACALRAGNRTVILLPLTPHISSGRTVFFFFCIFVLVSAKSFSVTELGDTRPPW